MNRGRENQEWRVDRKQRGDGKWEIDERGGRAVLPYGI
jgi:hypothetical protein